LVLSALNSAAEHLGLKSNANIKLSISNWLWQKVAEWKARI
jgi:hypothetical protein